MKAVHRVGRLAFRSRVWGHSARNWEGQTQSSPERDRQRGGGLSRDSSKPRAARIGNEAGPGWQPHAVAIVEVASPRRMELPAVRPVSKACFCIGRRQTAAGDIVPAGAVSPAFGDQQPPGCVRMSEARALSSPSWCCNSAAKSANLAWMTGRESADGLLCSRLQTKSPQKGRQRSNSSRQEDDFRGLGGPAQQLQQGGPHGCIMRLGIDAYVGRIFPHKSWRHQGAPEVEVRDLQQFSRPLCSPNDALPVRNASLLGARLLAQENCRGTCLVAGFLG